MTVTRATAYRPSRKKIYAEALTMWHNDPTFLGTYSSKRNTWFDTGQHLQ